MTKFVVSIFLGLSLMAGAAAAIAASTVMTFTPDDMHWIAGTGPSKGSSAATLVGDPNKAGMSVIRVRMPDGYTNKPHFHAHPEYITVMQGTLLFGTGDSVNKANAKILPAGSFIAVPAGLHHWSMAKGETVEEVAGEGPQTNIPVKKGAM